jgi:hypothetical protein
MQRSTFLSRHWRVFTLVAIAFLVAGSLPMTSSATIVPGTPGAESSTPEPTTPEAGNDNSSEIAPELPPPDLPSISAQGYSYDLDARLNTDLDGVPTQSAVYTMQREVTTKDDAQRLVDNLKIGADLVEQGENIWSANGDGSLFVSPDFIQYTSQAPIPDGDLPVDKDAIAFAAEFLRTSGLLPPNMGDGAVTDRSDDAKRMTVSFGPGEPGNVLSGYPGVTVTLGPNGIILEATKRWATILRTDVYQLRSANEAWQQVLSNQGYIEADIDAADLPAGATVTGSVTYNNVSIAYTTSGPPGGQQYLQPIYVFRGRIRLEGSDTTYAIRTYVPALSNSGAPVG